MLFDDAHVEHHPQLARSQTRLFDDVLEYLKGHVDVALDQVVCRFLLSHSRNGRRRVPGSPGSPGGGSRMRVNPVAARRCPTPDAGRPPTHLLTRSCVLPTIGWLATQEQARRALSRHAAARAAAGRAALRHGAGLSPHLVRARRSSARTVL